MRYSRKREIIKEAVRANLIHPTAEEIYFIVRREHPEISLGTVYRDLNQLADMGEIKKLSVPGGPDRFDGTLTPHQHAYCTKCGKVMDFDFDGKSVALEAEKQTGIKPSACDINIKGICCVCAENI